MKQEKYKTKLEQEYLNTQELILLDELRNIKKQEKNKFKLELL